MNNNNQLVDSYLLWLREKITTKNIDSIVEITTPFLDRHNDHLQIYVVPQQNNIKLTDDGYTISDLLMSGCNVHSSRKRKEFLNNILNGFGVSISKEDALFIETTIDQFPQKKHMLLQAMLSVNDMFLTTKEHVESIFTEDVEIFLFENDIRFSDKVNFTGKSGFIQNFDFLIPRSKSAGDRLIRAVNNPTKDRAENILFGWDDIKSTRKNETQLFTFLNDSNRAVNPDIISALRQYDVTPILWSNKKEYIDILSA